MNLFPASVICFHYQLLYFHRRKYAVLE